jgi:hypothetical protein
MPREDQVAGEVLVVGVRLDEFVGGYRGEDGLARDEPICKPHVDLVGPEELALPDTVLNEPNRVVREAPLGAQSGTLRQSSHQVRRTRIRPGDRPTSATGQLRPHRAVYFGRGIALGCGDLSYGAADLHSPGPSRPGEIACVTAPPILERGGGAADRREPTPADRGRLFAAAPASMKRECWRHGVPQGARVRVAASGARRQALLSHHLASRSKRPIRIVSSAGRALLRRLSAPRTRGPSIPALVAGLLDAASPGTRVPRRTAPWYGPRAA